MNYVRLSERALDDGGVYVIRGRGKRRYVGECRSLASRRGHELTLGIVRLVLRMPGAGKVERCAAEAHITARLRAKGREVCGNGNSGSNISPVLLGIPTTRYAGYE